MNFLKHTATHCLEAAPMNLQEEKVRIALAIAVIFISGGAFYFGTGLQPQWWLMWLAPLPVLLIASRISWRGALLVAFAARLLGSCSTVEYFRVTLNQVSIELRLVYLLLPVLVFTLAVMLFRAFLRRAQYWPAVFAFPSVIVAFEYLNSLWVGTFWNTAYTQLNDLPVLQLAAITGPWGISFVVLFCCSALAVLLLGAGTMRRQLLPALAATVICIGGYGELRLHNPPTAQHSIVLGLVSTGYSAYVQPFSESPEQQINLLQQYASEAREVAARGAQIVVLPEMMALVYGPYSQRADQIFEETARSSKAQVLFDVLNSVSGHTYNEARLYSASGNPEAVYRKHHPAYVLGEDVTPGTDIAVLDQSEGTLGLAICSDLDYSNPARKYGRNSVGLLLVPAWDSYLSASWHGHMAIMRGVENGYSIVRASKVGLLTVSDDRGRVIAETSAVPDTPFTSMLATVPVGHDGTLYDAWGDWFAWLNLVLLCWTLFLWVIEMKRAKHPSTALSTSSPSA